MTRKTKPPIALYSALADTTRCRIIEILADGPIPVHQLADAFSISRPAISRHLRVLKDAGLVAEVKKGRENLYAFRARKLDKAVHWLQTFSMPEAAEEVVGNQPAPEPVVEQPIVVPVAAAEPVVQEKPKLRFAKKPVQAGQAVEPDPISQMGFDF
jgi:DNA-binding transcriptional ArsR family regulator